MVNLATALALVNATRVLQDLDTLRHYGGTGGGRWGRGVSRRGLTPQDLASRQWLIEQMTAAGLHDPKMDGLGTVYGESGDARRPALLMGSHTDTQPEGGWLDGALGVIYALEAARVLHEAGAPGAWAVIDFQDEEGMFGTLVGSRSFSKLGQPPLDKMASARTAAGLSQVPLLHWDSRAAGWLGYLEGHIEQGPRLEAANASVGVVTAIVGMRQMHLAFSGRQGHAGGSPMAERADAGLAAMRLASGLDLALHEACPTEGACAGAVWTFPGLDGFISHSTIPGAANLTFQFRATDDEALDRIETIAREHCEGDRAAAGLPPLSAAVPVTCKLEAARTPLPATPMDADMVDCMAAAGRAAVAASPEAGTGGLLMMASRAIHDASPVAHVMPAAMLFVPSINGVSHSFDEHTLDADIAVGARAFVGAAAGILLGQCAA